MQDAKTIYKSSDLSLVSAILSTQKAEIIGSQRITPYKFEFHLQPLDICLQLERLYINGNLMVSAKAIADNIRLLKSLIKGDSQAISKNQYGNNR